MACVCMPLHVCVLRKVFVDNILCFVNTLIIIIILN